MSRRPPQRPKRCTIEDVAAAAQVSLATVSRALRGLPNVAPSTRERVQRIATELDYHPDPSAARLATGRTGAIAVIVPVVNTWYFSEIIAGVDAACCEVDHEVLVMSASARVQPGYRLASGLTHSVIGRADGVILVDLQLSDAERAALLASGLPAVTIGDSTDGIAAVGIDNVEAGRLATEHLIQQGHHRIGLIGGQRSDPLGFQVPTQRRRGYLAALAHAGIDIEPNLIVGGEFSVAGGYEACEPLFDLAEPPTAVVAMSDEIAFGVMMAADQRKISIPDDLSIVGIDDHDVAPVVGLTTVHQDVADQGTAAAQRVLQMLATHERLTDQTCSPLHVAVRSSTRRI